MGSISHELRPAVEVRANPTVASNAAMYFFYSRAGRSATMSSFETKAAIGTGHAVRSEVRRPPVVAMNE